MLTRRLRFRLLLLHSAIAALVCACGAVATEANPTSMTSDGGAQQSTPPLPPPDSGSRATDASSVVDAARRPPSGDLCSGSQPRMEINGEAVPVVEAVGKGVFLDCCDGAEVEVRSGLQPLLFFQWRDMGSGIGTARTIDIASPDAHAVLALGCDPMKGSCAGAEELYDSGFRGKIAYVPNGSTADVGYCVTVEEDPSAPHVVIHSMRLYLPHVATQ